MAKERLELSRPKAGDFESPASTIPPLGHWRLPSRKFMRGKVQNERFVKNLIVSVKRAAYLMAMLQNLYNKCLLAVQSPHAIWVLAFISFLESSIFPIPPDVMLIPMVIAAPLLGWRYAFVCTIASVAGAVVGYGLGYYAYDWIGAPMLEALGKADKIDSFKALFDQYGVWTVLIAGVTPFPFKVITILSGFVEFNFVAFILSSFVARALRFFLVAGLLVYFGEPIRSFIEKRLGLMLILGTVILIIGAYLIGTH